MKNTIIAVLVSVLISTSISSIITVKIIDKSQKSLINQVKATFDQIPQIKVIDFELIAELYGEQLDTIELMEYVDVYMKIAVTKGFTIVDSRYVMSPSSDILLKPIPPKQLFAQAKKMGITAAKVDTSNIPSVDDMIK